MSFQQGLMASCAKYFPKVSILRVIVGIVLLVSVRNFVWRTLLTKQ